VAAVLGDALHRVAVLGGREGMARSLGSVYGGAVTRFLGGSLRGVVSRVIDMPDVWSRGVAVSADGSTLLVSDSDCGSHAIHEFSLADGSRRRAVGCKGTGPLRFNSSCQLWIAPDGFVFVADFGYHRVQVLTPSLDLHGFVGVGDLLYPAGVCANADVVVVSEMFAHRISVFSRGDGALLRRFGSYGSGDSQLVFPRGPCFMSCDARVAVADCGNSRVSVFSVDGSLVYHVGAGALLQPFAVACSAFDELVVTDLCDDYCLCLFSAGAGSEMVHAFGNCADVAAVVLHGDAVVIVGASADSSRQCVFFE
jgi:hypothetical protein